jgi:hypothetical protein
MEQSDRHRGQRQGLAQKVRERLLAARRPEAPLQRRGHDVGTQIDANHRFAMRRNGRAQRRRQRVDAAALEPAAGDDRLAPDRAAIKGQLDALERLAFEAGRENIRPAGHERAIGGQERRHLDPGFGHRVDPAAIGAESRPAGAAQRQHGRIRTNRHPPWRTDEDQGALILPSDPEVARLEFDARSVEPPEPGAQQRRGLEGARGNTRPLDPTNVL